MVDGTVGAVDNSGGGTKKVDTSELQVGANTVERQRVVLSNNANPSAFANVFPAGFLRVTDEPTQVFLDLFDGGSLDTSIRWNAPVAAGGGSLPVVTGGNLTLATGTTANGYATMYSQPGFNQTIPGFLGISFGLQFEYPVVLNSYRFWGVGTAQTAPTVAAPLIDAQGFELYTDGKLYAVVYASGVRTVIQDMSAATGNSTQPTDGLFHRYINYWRADRSFWYVDQLDTVAATSSFVTPTFQTGLPLRFLAIAGATPPLTTCPIICTGMSVWDTGKNNQTISDGTYGFRKATVNASGGLAVDVSGSIMQGTDGGGRTRAISTNSFGALHIDSDSVLDTLREIRLELRSIRIGMSELVRQDLSPQKLK